MSFFLLLLYHSSTFVVLFSYGIYHLSVSTLTKPHLPRPYHPLPLPSSRPHLLRHLPLLLSLLFLLLSLSFHLLSPSSIPSIHTSLSLLLFLLLSLSLLLFPLPTDLTFLFASLSFSILAFSPSPSSPSDLQSISHSISSLISLSSALFSLLLAFFPHLHLANFALSLTVSLQGVWSLQSYFSLYVDAFIPEGCHKLLDVAEATTRCDLDTSRVRAEQVMGLVFAGWVVAVAAVGVGVYKVCGGGGEWGGGLRRFNGGGSYEALPTVGSAGDLEHVQMKALGKSTAQA